MSKTAEQLLATFESLPPNEQHELLVAMLRRSGELQSAALNDDALTGVADELFQTLDASESRDNDTGSR
ncbi:hypothetical protein [Candidatus Laterigemmans baculatus]|uniref:hypothetical protein n=1 Tax=Candidatus Laterigemmans baculatus TaxID=2770505 RepID=UPI0013DB2E10|nr:hypothetical protein [Candidatus Laterigemmans baculatus]